MSIDTEFELGLIETFAGNGKSRSTGDGKRAVKAGIPLPNHVCFDKEAKYKRHAEVFPEDCNHAFALGVRMAS